MQKIISLSGVAALFLCFVMVPTQVQALAQCDGDDVHQCSPSGTVTRCTEMWNGGHDRVSNVVTNSFGGATMCSILPGSVATAHTFVGFAPLGAPATCSFMGDWSYGSPGDGTFDCVLNGFGGLPVELMEFSIEDTADNQ